MHLRRGNGKLLATSRAPVAVESNGEVVGAAGRGRRRRPFRLPFRLVLLLQDAQLKIPPGLRKEFDVEILKKDNIQLTLELFFFRVIV